MINVKNVIEKMSVALSKEQLALLEAVLQAEEKFVGTNEELIHNFIESKRYENCSERTIAQYERESVRFCEWFGKSVCDANKRDIEAYIAFYRSSHDISDISLNNMRRYISAFFNYLENEDIIAVNPVRKTKAIKACKQVKKAFTEVEIETLRQSASNFRDKVIVDALNSSGLRISELISLNKEDIKNGVGIVRGKGNKEREFYFSEVAWDEVQKYLSERDDDSPALFISNRKERISQTRVEQIIRNMGRAQDIHAYPHKYRRTFATRMLNKGCPIQEVQAIMGHSSIDTTLIYYNMNKDSVRYDHKKYN